MHPFFLVKTRSISKIMLSECEEIITDPATCSEMFNNFFSDAVEDLDIDRGMHVDYSVNNPVDKVIEMYKNLLSILRIIKVISKINFLFNQFLNRTLIM